MYSLNLRDLVALRTGKMIVPEPSPCAPCNGREGCKYILSLWVRAGREGEKLPVTFAGLKEGCGYEERNVVYLQSSKVVEGSKGIQREGIPFLSAS